MPNVAKVLRDEIQRLARREVKAGLSQLKRDNVRLKKLVADLRGQLATIDRSQRDLRQAVGAGVAPVQAAATRAAQASTGGLPPQRPTSKSLLRLRNRLGLTQVSFGKLLGVSGQAVTQWEQRADRVRLRHATLAALADVQRLGKREARKRLEAMGVAVRPQRRIAAAAE